MTTVTNLPLELLHRRPDARQRSDAKIAELEESIARLGLINPLRVRCVGDGYEVIAGAHRLQACDLLGWHEVLRASDELNFSDLWAMNPAGEWRELKVVDAPLGRHAATLFAHDGSFFMACGNTNVQPSLSSEVFVLERLILPQGLTIPT